MDIQFKKGVLELCALHLLKIKDRYGYELAFQISKKIAIAEGTVYPLLRKLNSEGYVTTYLKESREGPPRKYYTITTKGKTRLTSLKKEWSIFEKKIHNFLKGE